jgi:hypothetical protein
MRGVGTGIGLLTLLLGLAGCHHTEPDLRPPKHPEELVAPPDDSRYQTPPTYSKMGVNQDSTQPTRSGPANPGGLPTRPGSTGVSGRLPGMSGGTAPSGFNQP